MEKFVGKWSVTKVPDNLDTMLQTMGIEEERRKMIASLTLCDFTYTDHGGDNWEVNLELPNGLKRDIKFKIGEEYDSATIDGEAAKAVTKIKDGKFVEHFKTESNLEMDVVREVTGNEMKTTMKYKEGLSIVLNCKRK